MVFEGEAKDAEKSAHVKHSIIFDLLIVALYSNSFSYFREIDCAIKILGKPPGNQLNAISELEFVSRKLSPNSDFKKSILKIVGELVI